jgi:hypothetical protein
MERHHTCINGHSLRAIGEGEEPTNTQEAYVIRLAIDRSTIGREASEAWHKNPSS